jgi:manganese-dependent inorganic pyrophosphatase
MSLLPHIIPRWEQDCTYVIGHQRPDTDAIAAALGYAWFLEQHPTPGEGSPRVLAARAGTVAEQTRFALERFGVHAPPMLAHAAPTFAHLASPADPLPASAPLRECLSRIGEGARVVPLLGADGRPLGIVTPREIALALARGGGAALDHPAASLLPPPGSASWLDADARVSDYRSPLLRGDADDFIVADADGRYLGLATRAALLEPPRCRLVLVDHNELDQAVPGADEAEILGVLDHHRLANPHTALPIPFAVEPVGSTSTLVAERCRSLGLEPPAGICGLLLSGLLADTLVFRSPTSTARDRAAAAWLAQRAGADPAEYGAQLLAAGAGLGSRSAQELLDTDRKRYTMAGCSVSVAQVEVGSLQELPDRRADLLDALRATLQRDGLDLACLLVTDVVNTRSRMLAAGARRLLAALPFDRLSGGEQDTGEYDLGDIVSRKKQLVPALESALETR